MKDHPSQWIPSGLTCRETAGLAGEYLDDRLPLLAGIRVGLHLASCAHCRAYFSQIVLIGEAARLFPKTIPSPVNRLRLRRHFAAQHSG